MAFSSPSNSAGSNDLGRLVGHPRVTELRIRVNRARDEAAEESRRGRPVETVIVIQHAYQHFDESRKTYQLA